MGKRRNQPLDSDSSSEDGSDLDSVIICGIFFEIIINTTTIMEIVIDVTHESRIFSIDFDKVNTKKNSFQRRSFSEKCTLRVNVCSRKHQINTP